MAGAAVVANAARCAPGPMLFRAGGHAGTRCAAAALRRRECLASGGDGVTLLV
jgi:hypothetical protein